MQHTSYTTNGGIRIEREIQHRAYAPADTTLAEALDDRRGVLLSSSFEFPGRYTRWDMGFVDPPLVFTARGRKFSIEALNQRARILLDPIAEAIAGLTAATVELTPYAGIPGPILQTPQPFPHQHPPPH